MDGKIRSLFVESTYTTRKLICILQATLGEGIMLDDTGLSYGGTPMEDDLTLEYNNVKAEATLFVIGGGLDHEKYTRLGLPNYNGLMDQYNKLIHSMTIADLKDYDATYPPARI